MPFDVSFEFISQITKNWEILKHLEFGRHKKCPLIHNPYLYLYLENLKRSAIPETINHKNRFVSVMINEEAPKRRCGYCKSSDHQTTDCPIKQSKLERPYPKKNWH